MKSMTTKFMMTAAALAIATGVASAEQFHADIPFAFRAGNTVLPAGRYAVAIKPSQMYLVVLTNESTWRSTLVLPGARGESTKGQRGEAPVITFECGISRCSLARMWTGSASPALTFFQPRLGKDERISATEIRTVKLNGD